MTKPRSSLYHRHRYPAEIIAEAVWLYFRFPLSFRMIEDMLAYRGIIVTYKPLYEWAEKFGQTFANNIQCRRPRLGYKWHLDECVISIKGEHYILWRSVDQDGFVLDVLVQKRHNTKAAKLFMRKLVSAQRCALRVMVTDKRNRGIFVGSSFVFESKSEISNTVHIASFASIFHAYGIPDFGKS
ncbi:IS6 family transposase, partial [Brucella sp. C7-11G]